MVAISLGLARAICNRAFWVLPTPKTANNQSSIRRISSQEAKERRDKGLCYYCDERYNPGHRCQRLQLFGIDDSLEHEIEETSSLEFAEVIPDISLHAMAGTDHSETLRL